MRLLRSFLQQLDATIALSPRMVFLTELEAVLRLTLTRVGRSYSTKAI